LGFCQQHSQEYAWVDGSEEPGQVRACGGVEVPLPAGRCTCQGTIRSGPPSGDPSPVLREGLSLGRRAAPGQHCARGIFLVCHGPVYASRRKVAQFVRQCRNNLFMRECLGELLHACQDCAFEAATRLSVRPLRSRHRCPSSPIPQWRRCGFGPPCREGPRSPSALRAFRSALYVWRGQSTPAKGAANQERKDDVIALSLERRPVGHGQQLSRLGRIVGCAPRTEPCEPYLGTRLPLLVLTSNRLTGAFQRL
jgi:hypothetical protein